MTSHARDPLYRRYRFPADVIAHVWLYFRFPLSLRMVEDMLVERGIAVSHQTIRLWAEKFGRLFANNIRQRSVSRLGDKWHLDEVVVTVRGRKQWLWRHRWVRCRRRCATLDAPVGSIELMTDIRRRVPFSTSSCAIAAHALSIRDRDTRSKKVCVARSYDELRARVSICARSFPTARLSSGREFSPGPSHHSSEGGKRQTNEQNAQRNGAFALFRQCGPSITIAAH
jgi:hypothetical protein